MAPARPPGIEGKAWALGLCGVVLPVLWAGRWAVAQERDGRVVRLAEMEIDPAQVESYKAALKEEIEASVRGEPGVLALYAVAVKEHPEQIRLFEMYAGVEAYRAHLETAHFKKYKRVTEGMVRSLRLVETEPVMLGAKGK